MTSRSKPHLVHPAIRKGSAGGGQRVGATTHRHPRARGVALRATTDALEAGRALPVARKPHGTHNQPVRARALLLALVMLALPVSVAVGAVERDQPKASAQPRL